MSPRRSPNSLPQLTTCPRPPQTKDANRREFEQTELARVEMINFTPTHTDLRIQSQFTCGKSSWSGSPWDARDLAVVPSGPPKHLGDGALPTYLVCFVVSSALINSVNVAVGCRKVPDVRPLAAPILTTLPWVKQLALPPATPTTANSFADAIANLLTDAVPDAVAN